MEALILIIKCEIAREVHVYYARIILGIICCKKNSGIIGLYYKVTLLEAYFKIANIFVTGFEKSHLPHTIKNI